MGHSRVRAVARLTWFAVASWLVVARAIRAVLSPFPGRWRLSCPHVSRWARLGARCLGIHARAVGTPPPAGALVVANHQGYADVVTIGGLFDGIFAARHDMRTWPLFGALAASGATIFINRDNKRAGYRGIAQVAAALGDGATVIAFPEGTSTDGSGVLPLRTGVFQAAIDASSPVIPAAIRYLTINGVPVSDQSRDVVGWFRGENFLRHLIRLGGQKRVEAEVTFGEPLLPPHGERRELAARAEEALRKLLGMTADKVPATVGRRLGGTPGERPGLAHSNGGGG